MIETKVANIFNEIWHRWEPNLEITGRYRIGDFGFTDDGFKIIVEHRETKQVVEILFNCTITAFRSTDEGRRLKLFYDLEAKYGSDFYRKWSFFKVENSDYLSWLSDQSYEISDLLQTKHFVILDSEEILDITSHIEPEFKILPSSELKLKFKQTIIMKQNGIINERNYSKDGRPVLETFDGNISIKQRG